MKCKDPILVANGIYRNFSLASPVHRETANLVFNCNKCLNCRRRQARELAMRCVLHASLYKENSFLTLTYDETKKGYHNRPDYTDIQKFKKRLRSHINRERPGHRIQIFNVMEYGKNGKKHWHLLVFNYDFSGDRKRHTISQGNPLYTSDQLTSLWGHGYCTIGDISMGSAMYQAQYTQKDFQYCNFSERKARSNHSGLGRDYFLKNYNQILTLGYIPFDGRKTAIPRYFLKLAHKHYAHFYDRTFFHPTPNRKTFYRFMCTTARKDIADLFKRLLDRRTVIINQLTEEWEENIRPYIYTKDLPDFVKSGQNQEYDLKKQFNQHVL